MEEVIAIIEGSVASHMAEYKAELAHVKEELKHAREERSILFKENVDLKFEIKKLSQSVDENEQYGRRDCLVLSGHDLPEPVTSETGAPEDATATKKVVEHVIENKLGIKLKGKITACHRLRKKDRAIVRFDNMEDRNLVYDSRFPKPNQPEHKVIIQESLTQKRGWQVSKLGNLKREGHLANFHTKNGTIFARATKSQRYVMVDPDWSLDEIMKAAQEAPIRHQGVGPQQTMMFNRSQTLNNIPDGRVASRRHDLEEYVVHTRGNSGRH